MDSSLLLPILLKPVHVVDGRMVEKKGRWLEEVLRLQKAFQSELAAAPEQPKSGKDPKQVKSRNRPQAMEFADMAIIKRPAGQR